MNNAVIIRHAHDVDIASEFLEILREADVEITTERYDDREHIVNCIEWATSANVAIFCAAAFFGALLKELGSETGKAIISAIKTQLSNAKQSRRKFCSSQDIEKLRDNPSAAVGRLPPPLEIRVTAEESHMIRLMFPASVCEQDVEKALNILHKDYPALISDACDPINLRVYVPNQGKWLSQQEIILYVRDGGKV